MGNKQFRTLYDCTGHRLHCRCRCRHVGIVDAGKAYHWFKAHRWPDSLDVAGKHFRCSRCGERYPIEIRPAPLSYQPTFPSWGIRDEDDWKRLIKRLRG